MFTRDDRKQLERVERKLDAVLAGETQRTLREETIMAAIDDLEAKVTALETALTDHTALMTKEHQELLDAIAANDPTRVAAAATRIGAAVDALKAFDAANPDPQAAPPAQP